MAVPEIQASRPVMITRRIIHYVTAGIALAHRQDEVRVVDALRTFIDQDPRLSRSRICEAFHNECHRGAVAQL